MLLGETPRDVSTSLGTGLQNIRQVSCDAITVAEGFLERIAPGILGSSPGAGDPNRTAMFPRMEYVSADSGPKGPAACT